MENKISFESMPQAITELITKIDRMQSDINVLKQRHTTQTIEPMIGIEEACKILHRAKSTVYALTQARKIPFYQPGKMRLTSKSPWNYPVSIDDILALSWLTFDIKMLLLHYEQTNIL